MKRFPVRRIVLHGHVEVLVRGAHVAFLVRLDSPRQVHLGHLREVGRTRRRSRSRGADLGIVLLASCGIRQHVNGFGQGLELPLRIRLVGAFVAVGMLLPGELPETLPDFRLGSGAIDSEHFVVVDLHSGFLGALDVGLPGQASDGFAHAFVVFQSLQITQD